MWVLWLICAVLLIIAVALLIRPLFKRCSDDELAQSQMQANQRKALNIELYEQKKQQIELDFKNGLLDEEARMQAQNEIEHSLIHDAESSASKELVQLSSASAKNLTMGFLVFIPIFSVVVYASVRHENIEQILASDSTSGAQTHMAGAQKQVPDISSMVISLEEKLEKDSNNAQGWNMLGRSYVVLKRYDDAVNAYAKAMALSQQDESLDIVELEINYVEALMQTGKKESYQTARELLATMLKVNPDNGDALWFMGFLDAEMGEVDLAAQRWSHLLTLLPPSGEQAQIVSTYLNQIKPGSAKVVTVTQPATPQVEASQARADKPDAAPGPVPGQQLTGSDEEKAFIASMIDRVEKRVKENPNDLKGWTSLGKSYGVLNRLVESAEAYAKAVALNSSDVNLLMDYSDAVIKTRDTHQLDKARIVFAQLVDSNPQNLDALFLSGSLARVAGDAAEAKNFWSLLLPQLPPGSEAYKSVEHNLKSL
ncbi:MAG: c-type cytochrome biogenesis protein CcmI [Gammaproteobacteria bacterium]|nr:c-type cytochrome biogenesis protein CcmI [Gammaproteobacteria bacterium]